MQKKKNSRFQLFAVAILVLAGIIMAAPQSDTVYAQSQPVSVSSCKLTNSASKLTVKAKVKTKTSAMGKKLYLLKLDANASETGKTGAKSIASVKTKKGTVTFKAKYDSSMLFQKFAVAYKKGGKYTIVSDVKYITNPEALATFKGKGPAASSKKGLQVEDVEDSLELGTQHAVINWTLNSIMNEKAANKIAYKYKNKTYYFDNDQLIRNDEVVRKYNAEGVRVTIILLLPKDSASTGTAAMQFGGYTYTLYSSIKTSTSKGCRALEAVMSFLATRYGEKENLVCGWIIGNEVNSACVWNYGGNKSLDSYMENYARSFRICYNAVKSVNKNAKVYISLDYNWNVDADGSGKRYFTAKATLDKFYEKLKSKGKINFQIAYHAYPQGMSDPVFWDDTQAANSTNAKIINFKNIKVLTKYAKNKFGKKCTIMLSEQSFNSTKGEAVQAAAYAYAYYISESNSMIEAFIYGREFDHPSEMNLGYHWGLCNNWRQKRLIWHVFQYIDTKESFKFTDPLLSYTNIKKWNKISGFKKSKITKMKSKLNVAEITGIEPESTTSLKIQWEKLNTGDGYEIYRNGQLIKTISGNTTLSYTDKKLTTGISYQYKVRMYKEAPQKSNPDKREKLYGEFSPAVSAIVSTGQVEINDDNSSVTGNVIKVAWKKMSDVSGFEIVRSTQENGIYVKVGTVDGSKTSYSDTAPVSGVTYYYKVRAYVTVNGTNYYGKYSEPIDQLSRIQLSVKIENGKVALSWTKCQNALKYIIYVQPQNESNYRKIKTVTDQLTYSCNSYKDKNETNSPTYYFMNGVEYSFRVKAILSMEPKVYSKYSNEPSITINASVNPVGIDEESLFDTETTETELPDAGQDNSGQESPTDTETTEGTEDKTPETETADEAEDKTPAIETTEETEPKAPETEAIEGIEPEAPDTEAIEGTEPEAPDTEAKEGAESKEPDTNAKEVTEPKTFQSFTV